MIQFITANWPVCLAAAYVATVVVACCDGIRKQRYEETKQQTFRALKAEYQNRG